MTAESDDALVDALGEHYVDAHRSIPMTEGRIREQVVAQACDA